jgi:hypothetical protein
MLMGDRHTHDADVELHMFKRPDGTVRYSILAMSDSLGNRTIHTTDGKTALDCYYHPYAFSAGKHKQTGVTNGVPAR